MENEYDIKEIMEEIEQDLIVRMKRTLWSHKQDEDAKNFKWSQWQALKLKQLEEFKEANKKIFDSRSEILDKELYRRIKEQFKEGASKTNKEALKAGVIRKEDSQLGGSFFGLNHRKLDALIKSTKEDMQDVKYATLRMANDQYRQIVFKAQVYANSGAGTVKQAIDMASKDFLARGFNCIEYSNGSRHNIADYCDLAIRTANKRANLMGEGEMRKKLENPLVYISKHNTSCEKCGQWQGRVYIDDAWSGGKAEDGKYPLLSTAIAGGLFHPRCRHGSSTYFEGINDEPEEVTEAEHNHSENDAYTQYLQQRKKQYERLAIGSLAPENIEKYQNKAKELQNQIEGSKIEEDTLLSNFNKYKDIEVSELTPDQRNLVINYKMYKMGMGDEYLELAQKSNTKIAKLENTKNRKSNYFDNAFENRYSNAKQYTTEQSDALTKLYQSELDKLNANQKSSIADYTGMDFDGINRSLRTEIKVGERLGKNIDNITEVLNNSTTLEDMIVHRHVEFDGASKFTGLKEYQLRDKSIEELNELLKGKECSDKAFISTSIRDFKDELREVVYDIYMSKGTKGLYINELSTSYKDIEYEFLLQRETKFKIQEVFKDTDGTLRIVMEVIGNGI